MTARLLPVVTALTRGWVRVYTWRMPGPLADARREEIESDLWEMQHDPDTASGRPTASIALKRLIAGTPSDIAWRFDNAAFEEQFVVRRVLAIAAAAVLVLSVSTVSARFLETGRDVTSCAPEAPMPQMRAAILQEVVRCAGALFASRR